MQIMLFLFIYQGFRKIDPDRWEFANEGFLRDQKHLLKNINRKKSSHAHSQPQPLQQNASASSCIEVGKFGLDEEIERLKRDKNVLMQELVRLRQQQQTTDHQLQSLNNRIQGMEQRQQQMMSFLAKAMNSPGFLAQLVQQNNANNHQLTSRGNKKRRLPNQGEFEAESASSPDGQMVKYQPSMTEAAKLLLMQILNTESSPMLDSYKNTDNISSRSSSSRSSGDTSQDVPLSSGILSSALSEIQSPSFVTDTCKNILPILPEQVPQPDIGLYVQPTDVGSMNHVISEADSAAEHNGVISIELEKLYEDADMDIFIEGDDTKLPGITDSFWEQILSASQISGDAEEVNSSLPESNDAAKVLGRGWDGIHGMDNLTEQMGLLTSKSEVL